MRLKTELTKREWFNCAKKGLKELLDSFFRETGKEKHNWKLRHSERREFANAVYFWSSVAEISSNIPLSPSFWCWTSNFSAVYWTNGSEDVFVIHGIIRKVDGKFKKRKWGFNAVKFKPKQITVFNSDEMNGKLNIWTISTFNCKFGKWSIWRFIRILVFSAISKSSTYSQNFKGHPCEGRNFARLSKVLMLIVLYLEWSAWRYHDTCFTCNWNNIACKIRNRWQSHCPLRPSPEDKYCEDWSPYLWSRRPTSTISNVS